MKLHRRYLGSIAYAANATRTLEIPRNYALVALDLKLVVSLTRTASVAGAAADCKDCAPAQLVRNLTVKANGSDTIKSIDMETLHRHNELTYGVRPQIDANVLRGFAVIAQAVCPSIFARIPFAMPRAIKEVDTLLDTAALSSLDLIVTWGVGADIMNDLYNTDGVVTIVDAILHVTAIEYLGVPAGSKFMLYNQWVKQSQVLATTARHQIKLPVGNVYRGLLIKTSSAGNQVATILPFGLAVLNEITLRSGTEVYVNEIAGILACQNRLEQQVEVIDTMPGLLANVEVDHKLQALNLLGYYYIDFCRDGRLSEALDTRMLSDLELMLQVVYIGVHDFIDVYADELVLPAVTA